MIMISTNTYIYICYVRPVLESSTQVWSPILKGNIDRIEAVQRYFTRRLEGLHHFSYVERLDRLKLESLESRRIKHDLCLFYKLVNNLVILDVHDSYSFRESYRGHSKMLFVNFSRTDKRKFYWINRIVEYWNSLSNDIVNAPSIAVFKRC